MRRETPHFVYLVIITSPHNQCISKNTHHSPCLGSVSFFVIHLAFSAYHLHFLAVPASFVSISYYPFSPSMSPLFLYYKATTHLHICGIVFLLSIAVISVAAPSRHFAHPLPSYEVHL
ncbi:hypothetical protein CRENBAI_012202 [Crenichthys baileyi]|uniref:Uncharacterized protein n=1 Tax=Crenichthys baileyi TaxID=28760 RepID=A0AAV9S572_9TELE